MVHATLKDYFSTVERLVAEGERFIWRQRRIVKVLARDGLGWQAEA
jgi:hypothetical protein